MKMNGSNNRGLTLIEVVVILGCCVLLFFLLAPNLAYEGPKARRVNCLANLNGLHKGLASWGLDPSDPTRPPFPPTNMHSALKDMGIHPNMFICPTAARDNNSSSMFSPFLPVRSVNRSIGISPATNTAQITASNCNYNYWTLRTGHEFVLRMEDNMEDNGDQVLVCDRNGLGNASNAVGSWGGNHGDGGNLVKDSGEGKWVGTNEFEMSALKTWMFDLSRSTNGVGVVTNN